MQLNFKKVDSSNGNTNAGDMLFVNNDKGIYIVESDGSKTKYGGSEYTSSNKLSADFIKDGSTNKVVTETEKTEWDNKQPGNLIVIAGEEVEDHNNTRTTNYSVSDVQDAVDAGKNVLLQWSSLSLPLVFISSEFAIYCLTVAADSTLSSNMPTCVLSVVQRNNTATYTEYDFNSVAFTGEADPVFTASAAYGITATDITNWNNKVSNVQSDWNATTGAAVILNKPTIPSTLDQIADGSTRKLSDYLPLAGGHMSSLDSSIFFGENGYGFTKISYDGIAVRNGGYFDGNQIEMTDPNADGGVGGIYVTEDDLHGYFKNYDYTFPKKTGTVALTSDVPAAVTESTVSGWGFTKNTGTLTGVKFNNTNATINGTVAEITAAIPSTLDQIVDGSTRKLSDYYSKVSGISLTNNTYPQTAISYLRDESLPYNTTIKPDGVYIDGYGTLNGLVGDGSCGTNYLNGSIEFYGLDNSHSELYIPYNKTGVLATLDDIPNEVTESTVSGWGYLKANDVSTKADKSAVISSLSLNMDSTTYTVTLSGTMADGSTFTVNNPIDLPLESMVVNGSYNNSTKKVVLTLKNGSTVDFSVADLVSGLQSEITSSNKLSADLIQDGTTNKVYTAEEQTKLDSIESGAEVNVKSDWEAASGPSEILNKPTIPTDASVASWGYIKSYTETDPIFTSSAAYGIATTDILNWNAVKKGTNNYLCDSSGTAGLKSVSGSYYALSEEADGNEDFILAITNDIPTDASVAAWGYIKSYIETDPTVPAWAKAASKPTYTAAEVGALPDTTTIPTQTTDASVANWGYIKTIADASIAALGYTKNTGTLTGVKFNNTNATVSNGVASITANIPTVNDATLTIKKNGTSIGTFTANASTDTSVNITVNELPTVSGSDNGKILQVVNGQWTLVTPVSIYNGSGEPSNILGNNGDIYIQS